MIRGWALRLVTVVVVVCLLFAVVGPSVVDAAPLGGPVGAPVGVGLPEAAVGLAIATNIYWIAIVALVVAGGIYVYQNDAGFRAVVNSYGYNLAYWFEHSELWSASTRVWMLGPFASWVYAKSIGQTTSLKLDSYDLGAVGETLTAALNPGVWQTDTYGGDQYYYLNGPKLGDAIFIPFTSQNNYPVYQNWNLFYGKIACTNGYNTATHVTVYGEGTGVVIPQGGYNTCGADGTFDLNLTSLSGTNWDLGLWALVDSVAVSSTLSIKFSGVWKYSIYTSTPVYPSYYNNVRYSDFVGTGVAITPPTAWTDVQYKGKTQVINKGVSWSEDAAVRDNVASSPAPLVGPYVPPADTTTTVGVISALGSLGGMLTGMGEAIQGGLAALGTALLAPLTVIETATDAIATTATAIQTGIDALADTATLTYDGIIALPGAIATALSTPLTAINTSLTDLVTYVTGMPAAIITAITDELTTWFTPTIAVSTYVATLTGTMNTHFPMAVPALVNACVSGIFDATPADVTLYVPNLFGGGNFSVPLVAAGSSWANSIRGWSTIFFAIILLTFLIAAGRRFLFGSGAS